MSIIISGIFITAEQRDQALAELARFGVAIDNTARFYNSPYGQHSPPTRHAHAPPGVEAEGAGDGALTGAGVGMLPGVVAGVAATPLVGLSAPLLGAAIGAYAGSLSGALHGVDAQDSDALIPAVRHGGPVLAVTANTIEEQQCATRVLLEAGALQVERASGDIFAGEWVDYDPASVPLLLADLTHGAH